MGVAPFRADLRDLRTILAVPGAATSTAALHAGDCHQVK
jgi:hypothetical protein